MIKQAITVLFFVLVGCVGILRAQSMDEDKLLMQQYKLPAAALPDSLLAEVDSVMFLDGGAYTGTAYSRYDNGQLQHVAQYVKGRKHGVKMIWYPDGKPQLLANYRHGYLNGRFKGWYQFGAVIYDLFMREGKYKGDDLYETDTVREATTTTESEPTGDGVEQGSD